MNWLLSTENTIMKNHTTSRAIALTALVVMFFVTVSAAGTPKPTLTTFASSSAQLLDGDTVTLTATVTAVATADASTPTGSVEFFDGAASLGAVNLSSTDSRTAASLTLNTFAVGPHPISAVYSGDSAFGGSVSVPQFVLVLARQ